MTSSSSPIGSSPRRSRILSVAVVAIAVAALGLPASQIPAVAASPGHAYPHHILPAVVPKSFSGDVRDLSPVPSAPFDEPEIEEPASSKAPSGGAASVTATPDMPALSGSFAGLSHDGACTGGTCGAGYPPDTVGDVGPNHYVEAVNTAVGIYSKTGTQLAAFTFNSLWSGAGTGTACDTANNGDPTVVYDPMADRWFVADFAWTNLSSGPYIECVAV